MLYHLFEYLRQRGTDFSGIGLMQYISVRGILGNITAIIIALAVGKKAIGFLQKKQIGEEIRNLGLEGQLAKKGTPTMGGLIIIFSLLIPTLLFCDLSNTNTLLLIFTTVWLGFLGCMDDYIKVFKHNKEGLNGKYKIIGQVILGLVVGLALCFDESLAFRESNAVKASETVEQTVSATVVSSDPAESNAIMTTIPFVKNNEFNYAWLSPFKGKAGDFFSKLLYILVIIFIITGCSNGANLTDGMDGLATGVSAIVGAALGVLAYVSGNVVYADYFNIMYIGNSGDIAVFMMTLIGALLGFLWYNSYPAQIFMGDTGSLTLGGIIGVCAVLIRKELLLPILCGIFLVESLSVIIQRTYFKYTKKKYGEGRRVFKMSPLHHHFQKEDIDAVIKKPVKAHPEAKIVMRFYIVSMVLAVLTIITLKIR
ncbi:MAG: phospho-N-acetylmuramoyl-pentapeptide-transferase [Bacteroidales bacterium]|nr:phospho-N-acetylmuramoyl-pentapeptide-transferase [Bacteroidales bacterium]MBO7487155.1 phospho-N-acetylmuramoyl-pentapeptide-transferase [Bacteroidales bacterium]